MGARDHERCQSCEFDGASYDDASLLDALRALGPTWVALLAMAGPELRVRPAPEVWSAIEYAAHTRDILALHVYGVELALTGRRADARAHRSRSGRIRGFDVRRA